MHIAVFIKEAGYDTDGNEGPVDGVISCLDRRAAESLAAGGQAWIAHKDTILLPITAAQYDRIRVVAARDKSELLYLDEDAPSDLKDEIYDLVANHEARELIG